jgi:uncharacterized protein YfcZ (UPF0381/DUF406 family)
MSNQLIDDEDDADEAATISISIDQQHDNQQSEYANYGKPTAAKDELDDISIAKEMSQVGNNIKLKYNFNFFLVYECK